VIDTHPKEKHDGDVTTNLAMNGWRLPWWNHFAE
jgi:hypothetical protein